MKIVHTTCTNVLHRNGHNTLQHEGFETSNARQHLIFSFGILFSVTCNNVEFITFQF